MTAEEGEEGLWVRIPIFWGTDCRGCLLKLTKAKSREKEKGLALDCDVAFMASQGLLFFLITRKATYLVQIYIYIYISKIES